MFLLVIYLCGDARAVKWDSLRSYWLSAFEGSNPSSRIYTHILKMEKNNSQKINNNSDISETFGTQKRKMSGQEFKDLVRDIEPAI